MSEKTLPPTQKRIREAREKGQVAKAQSIPHLLAAIGVFELINATSDQWLSQAPMLLGWVIDHLGDTRPATRLGAGEIMASLAPVAVSVVIVSLLLASALSIIGNVMQTGVVVATKGFFQLDRLDPVQHVKQWFTTQQLGQLLMDAMKVAVICFASGMVVLASMDGLLRLADASLVQGAQTVLHTLVLCERFALIPLLFLVAVDWVLAKQKHIKSLRMAHEEVARENKDQFGDKHVRRQRNEFRRDMLAGELTENTRKANAVVTNPTHFAVALLYEPDGFPLPRVVARGMDDAAALMRRVAQHHGIPVIRSPRLARMLYSVGREGRPVPRLTFKAVAAVYRVVAQIKSGELTLGDAFEMDEEVPVDGVDRGDRSIE